MKFLICGLGSIGQRHVRMIQKITGGTAEIAAFRSRKLDVVISDSLEARYGENPESHYGLTCFDTMNAALAWAPDAVFVTNPISMHIDTALKAARAGGSHVFIEKPLDSNVAGAKELELLLTEKGLKCMVGYQMRYHPAYLHIKNLIEDGALGTLISADLHFGEWLPGMHPYEDYRESHAARNDQGGGVLLCLSHEIDIAYWLFGMPASVFACGGHLSDLEIDVEDTADIILSVPRKHGNMAVHIHLDFLQKPPRRYIQIVGDRGSVTYDYHTSILHLNLISKEPRVTSFRQFERNAMFFDEVRDFIDSIKTGRPSPIPLKDGLKVLEICLASKRSMASGLVEVLT